MSRGKARGKPFSFLVHPCVPSGVILTYCPWQAGMEVHAAVVGGFVESAQVEVRHDSAGRTLVEVKNSPQKLNIQELRRGQGHAGGHSAQFEHPVTNISVLG